CDALQVFGADHRERKRELCGSPPVDELSIETPGQIPVRYGIDVVHSSGGNRICHGRSCVPTKRYGALRNLRHRSGKYGQCVPTDDDKTVSNNSTAPTVQPMMISDI